MYTPLDVQTDKFIYIYIHTYSYHIQPPEVDAADNLLDVGAAPRGALGEGQRNMARA